MLFKVKNKKFIYIVDDFKLDCGRNSALGRRREPAQDADGGKSKCEDASAKYAMGYCDAHALHDLKVTNGAANVEGWKPSEIAAAEAGMVVLI